MEPVNILLPYKARFSWIKQCWGKEVKHGSITDKAFIIIWARWRTLRCCSPAEYGGNVTTATCWGTLMRHCGSNKHKDMSCNYRERRRLKLKCPSFHAWLYLTVFLTPPCDYQGFLKRPKPPKEYFWEKRHVNCWRPEAPSGMDATTVATSDNSWQYSRLLPVFSFLPCFSTPFISKSSVQEVSWLTLHRKFYREVWPENIKAAICCVSGCLNGSFSTVSKTIKRAD